MGAAQLLIDLTSTEAVGCSESKRIKVQNFTWLLQKRLGFFHVSDFKNVTGSKLAKTPCETVLVSIILIFTISPM